MPFQYRGQLRKKPRKLKVLMLRQLMRLALKLT
jgi:hypothetical protein